jgi:flagellar basal-body rod protein FlgC
MSSFDISASGLSAERRRLDIVANNIANAETTRTAQGGPYRKQQVVFSVGGAEGGRRGVRVTDVIEDPRPPHLVYRPGHPDADAKGFVQMPNVNVMEEMVDMVTATRSYEANVAALDSSKTMIKTALEIGKG